jgi:hypothetical protein
MAAALALLMPIGASQAQTAPSDRSALPGKKFAAYEYGWYPIRHADHFEKGDGLPRYWHKTGKGKVGTQNGMITIMSRRQGSIAATMHRKVWDRGRWEIRFRTNTYETAHTDYVASAELIPAGNRPYNCGARNIALASYRPGGRQVNHYIRTLPNNQFSRTKTRMNLSSGYWHTYAVEVTPRRISWFTDGRVRATERRPAALSGVKLALRLKLTAKPGERMNQSRLQVDTVRYFTLKSPNDKSIKAPRPTRGTYGRAC